MTSPSEEFVIRKRKLLLDNAAEFDAEGISFTHLRVSDSSDANANVQIIFANLDNPGITLKRGIRLENFAIRSAKVWFTNTAQPGKFVEIEYWGGPPVGPPRIVNEGLFVDVSLAIGQVAATSSVSVGIASTTLLVARGGRGRALIKNTDNLNPVFVADDADPATTADYRLGPGEQMEWHSQDGANAIAVGGTVLTALADYFT